MAKKTTLDSIELLAQKKRLYLIRVTTFIKGSNKNKFIDDCTKRGVRESEMNRNILDIYYTIVELNPHIQSMEMVEIKKLITDKVKL